MAVEPLDDLTVLIPVHNDPQGLSLTLDSIVERETISVTVVDDGSEPPIPKIERDGLAITVIRASQNGGIERALNLGLSHIKASEIRFVARLDAGDLAMPGRFERQREVLRTHEEVVVVGGAARFVSEEGRYLYEFRPPATDDRIRTGMFRANMFVHSASMYRLSSALEVGGYPLGFEAREDHEFFWRMLGVGRGRNLQSIEIVVVWSEQGISAVRRKRQVWTGIRIIARRWRTNPVRASVGVGRNLVLLAAPVRVLALVKRLVR